MTNIAILPPRGDGFVRKKWSVTECAFLTENDLLSPGKYELIEGEILFKMGQGRVHIFVVARIIALLTAHFGDHVQSQAQIGIGAIDAFNDPEPDVAVLRESLHAYLERDPNPATEVLLVVEAANTTLPGDTTIKANLYARFGITEYWVVAIPNRTLIVHRQPTADGYTDIKTYPEIDSVASLAAPDSPIRIADILP